MINVPMSIIDIPKLYKIKKNTKCNLLTFLTTKDLEISCLLLLKLKIKPQTVLNCHLNESLPKILKIIKQFLKKNTKKNNSFLKTYNNINEFYDKYKSKTFVNKTLECAYMQILTHIIEVNQNKTTALNSLMNIIDFIKNPNHQKRFSNNMLIDSDNSQSQNQYLTFLQDVYQIINHFPTKVELASIIKNFEIHQKQIQSEENEYFLSNLNIQLNELLNNFFNFHENVKQKITDFQAYIELKELNSEFYDINKLQLFIKDYVEFKIILDFFTNSTTFLEEFSCKEKLIENLTAIKTNVRNSYINYNDCLSFYNSLLKLEELLLAKFFDEKMQIEEKHKEKPSLLFTKKKRNPLTSSKSDKFK
jgi:hypothetical protein